MPIDPTHVKVLRAEDIIRERADTEAWWKKLYLPAIVMGLGVTIRNMIRNLIHPSGLPTIRYPEERRDYGSRFRGRHYLKKRPSGEPRCVACMMCATACPADCIYIVAAEHPNPDIEKYPARFDIDVGKCVFCGFCVEACPEDAIRMDTGILEFAAESREGLVYDRDTLLALEPAGADGLPTSAPPAGQFRRGLP